MNISELKVDSRDLVKIGYMEAGHDIENMLKECAKSVDEGKLKNNREGLLFFLRA